MKKIFIFLLVASCLFGSTVLSQPLGADKLDKALNGVNNLSKINLETRIGDIIAVVLSMLGTIFLILTIYAGILWMTASGDEGKIEKSKQILSAAVIGLAIVMSAYTITYFVGSNLGQ